MSRTRDAIVALLPAAGAGRRMGSAVAKQYLPLNGLTVLDWTIQRIQSVARVTDVVVAVSAQDYTCGRQYPAGVEVIKGGDTRAQTVRKGLQYIHDNLNHSGLVLVHDAARPCVRVADINALIDAVGLSADGGILAVPVHDTLKRSNTTGHIEVTIDRSNMWRAVTPQLFLQCELSNALESAEQAAITVTDEASAMEYAGFHPLIVASAPDNIKITVADDLQLASQILEAQQP